MIQPEYKSKNNTIFMGFDSIEINLNKIHQTQILGVLSDFVNP